MSESQSIDMLNITLPDVLLASDWDEQCSRHGKEQSIMTGASDDFADYKHVAGGT